MPMFEDCDPPIDSEPAHVETLCRKCWRKYAEVPFERLFHGRWADVNHPCECCGTRSIGTNR